MTNTQTTQPPDPEVDPMTETIATVPEFPTADLPRLEDEVARLNRRAARIKGMQGGLVVELGAKKHSTRRVTDVTICDGVETARTRNVAFESVEVTLRGSIPTIDGWGVIGYAEKVVAATGETDEQGTALAESRVAIIAVAPDVAKVAPRKRKQLAADGLACDHCGRNSHRAKIWIIAKGRAQKLVGSTCLKDFSGAHASIDSLLRWADDLRGLVVWITDSDEGFGSRFKGFDVAAYLVASIIAIDRHGYRSKGKAWKEGGESTASIADNLFAAIEAGRESEVGISPDESKSASVEAGKVLAWAKKLSKTARAGSDYLDALHTILSAGYVGDAYRGYVASAPGARARALADRAKSRGAAKLEAAHGPSEHVGEIGKRADFGPCVVESMRANESDWGVSYLVKLRTAQNNVLVWWASSCPWTKGKGAHRVEIGETVDVRATVKAHKSFREVCETRVNRAALA